MQMASLSAAHQSRELALHAAAAAQVAAPKSAARKSIVQYMQYQPAVIILVPVNRLHALDICALGSWLN
jgi:hypothetical protein